MARRVIDVARVHAVIAGHDPEDPTSAPDATPDVLGRLADGIEGVRVLVPTRFVADVATAEVKDALAAAAEVLTGLGAVVEEGELPGAELAQGYLMPVVYADCAAYHRERLQQEPERFGHAVRTRLQPGLDLAAVDYAASLRWIEGWRREAARLFRERCDVVLTPTMPCGAPPAEGIDDIIRFSEQVSRFTWVWSAAGVPALSVPCGFDRDGLPLGMQLAGPRWSEPLLLRIGHAYQGATDWHLCRPRLAA